MHRRSWKFALSAAVPFLICLTLFAAPAAAQLDSLTIPKYETSLFIPPVMPTAGTVEGFTGDYYEIAKRQFQQQILPTTGPGAPFPATTVWGFGAVNTPGVHPAGSFRWPSYTIEADVDRRVRVKWINDLVADNGAFLPHLFAAEVDTSFHWANPPQECAEGAPRPDCAGTGSAYDGPVPMVVHLHGSHVFPDSDGFPEAWYLPAANNIPAGYATVGSDYNQFKAEFAARYPTAPAWDNGFAIFQYRNDQRATTLWFHDHTLGITRLNIYAGPVGFYLLRGGPFDQSLGYNPPGSTLGQGASPGPITEIPIVLQLRGFETDGSLLFNFPDTAATVVANGNTWPSLEVEQRRYRFRFLNADNEESFDLMLATTASPDAAIANAIWWIGADGGFLPAPVPVTNVPLHIAERADVIIDFSNFSPGDVLYLVNGDGDPGTTDQVLQFQVVGVTSTDTTTPPAQLTLPSFPRLGAADFTRRVSTNAGIGGAGNLLGIVAADNTGIPLFWDNTVTETPQFGDTEIWEIHGFDGTHPIHIHMVQFEILSRTQQGDPIVDGVGVGPGETGTKDTVVVSQGEIVRVKALFDIGGKFVWHCHILEHEDDQMMRPYEVSGGPAPGPEPGPEPQPEPTPIGFTTSGGGGGCAMVASKGDINDLAGTYGALILVALGLAFRRRLKRR